METNVPKTNVPKTNVPKTRVPKNTAARPENLGSRRSRRTLWLINLALVGVLAAQISISQPLAATEAPAGVEWRVSTYDVYVDGILRPNAKVLRANEPDRLAVLVADGRKAWVVEDDKVLSLPRRAFTFEDPRHATTRVAPRRTDHSTAEVGDGQWLGVGKHQIMILPHQGGAGTLEVSELWQRAPLWRELRDEYAPDAQAVATFASEQRPLRFKVAFGTWCGDSRRSVPRLLKTLDTAGNSGLEVELLSIGRGFTEPMDQVRELRLTNVPTVIVYDGDREIGRFVENPSGDSIEHDLAALLEDRPLETPEKANDEDELVASGELVGVGADNQNTDREQWRLFATEDGGQRLWVLRHDATGATEVWQRFDADGRCTFAEVTRRSEQELSRTRLGRDGQKLSSTTRGNVSGVVRQVADLPAEAVVLAPTLVSTAMVSRKLQAAGLSQGQAFLISPVGETAPGRLEAWTLEALDGEELRLNLDGVEYHVLADSGDGIPGQARVNGQQWKSTGTE